MDTDVIRDKVIECLQTVFDPEIPVNIYELGLIYRVDILPINNVQITMTLTAPSCPAAQSLPIEVDQKVRQIEGVNDVHVVRPVQRAGVGKLTALGIPKVEPAGLLNFVGADNAELFAAARPAPDGRVIGVFADLRSLGVVDQRLFGLSVNSENHRPHWWRNRRPQ